MRIVQLLPTLSFGDAVGNDTLALRDAVAAMGFETAVYAENIDKRLPLGSAKSVDSLRDLKSDDILIYHKSTGTELSLRLDSYKCRRIMVYHNITPPEFFRPYSTAAASLTEFGYRGLDYLRDKVDYCLADSEYNRGELLRRGFTCPIDVRPVLIRFDDYRQTPDKTIIKKFGSDKKNLLFVGRIAPNKKQENVIRTFFEYRKINPDSRLILVGSYNGMENYFERLRKYTEMLGIADDVIFTGHIKFSEILAWYSVADAFICMSEHEGFCVPLVEAMYFNVPVIAYNTSAIPDTLGGCGVLLDDNDPLFAAKVTDRVLSDNALREHIISGQRKRLKDFSHEKVSGIFTQRLKSFIEKKKEISE